MTAPPVGRMVLRMRTVIASADPDLTIALQFALRHEPGFDVVASVTAPSGLLALAESSIVDLFVIDAALAAAADVICACQLAGSPAPAALVVVASEDERVGYGDLVVRKGQSPSELLDALRHIRRDRRHAR